MVGDLLELVVLLLIAVFSLSFALFNFLPTGWYTVLHRRYVHSLDGDETDRREFTGKGAVVFGMFLLLTGLIGLGIGIVCLVFFYRRAALLWGHLVAGGAV